MTQSASSGAVLALYSATNFASAVMDSMPAAFWACRLLASSSSQYLPKRRAACSPESFSIAAWSALEILFQVASFMTKAKLVL